MESSSRPPADWYLEVAEHLGDRYLDYEFTKGTEQEVDFLCRALALSPGKRVLDVGCGPGRHAVELVRRGINVVGIDLSPAFLSVARRIARQEQVIVSFFEMDALNMSFEEEFDAVISVCEGAFGLGLDDLAILRGIRRALKPGGHAAVGAANLLHIVDRPDSGELDPVSLILTKTVEGVIGAGDDTRDLLMYNSCYTPRELEWIANGAGLDTQYVAGVEPGNYQGDLPTKRHPELLLLARRGDS